MIEKAAAVEHRPVAMKHQSRRDVQGLRALAVVLVIVNHLTGFPGGGFIGVDVFFVLSGFLITGLLVRERERTGKISLPKFYLRRFRRILPAALLVVAVTAATSWFVFSRGRAELTGIDALWTVIFGANWRFAATGTDYLQATGPISPLQHYWSLAVEEQFYLVWPLLLVAIVALAHRKFRRTAGTAIAIIGALSFGWAILETATEPTWAYFSTFSRVWELAAGALLAIGAHRLPDLSDRLRALLAWAGLGAIGASAILIDADTPFPGPFALAPVLGTCAVLLAGVGSESRTLTPLTNRVATYVGDISYSLYLWHFPVIVFAESVIESPVLQILVALVAMISLSTLSYHFVENPIRRSNWLESGHRRDRVWKGIGLAGCWGYRGSCVVCDRGSARDSRSRADHRRGPLGGPSTSPRRATMAY